jgi:hypothetical protein
LCHPNDAINHEQGERGVGAPCYFCTAGLFVDILHHLTSAHDEGEMNLKFAEHCENFGAMTLNQFKQRLANKAWFRDRNYPSWWLQNGVLMPLRKF